MALPAPARYALMLGEPAWQRAAFDEGTALVGGVVQLAWEARGEGGEVPPVLPVLPSSAGLAFDKACRLYQSLPGEQRVQRWLWAELDPARPQRDPPPDNVLVNGNDQPQVWGSLPVPCGAFLPLTVPLTVPLAAPLTVPPTPAFTPRALACDDAGHLYVLDTATAQVWIVDLAQRMVLRAEAVPADAVDIAWRSPGLWVLCASGALQLLAAALASRPAPVAAPADAARLAFAADGRLYVLLRAHAADAGVVLLGRPGHWLAAPQVLSYAGDPPFAFASALAVAGCGEQQRLVVARRREEVFTRVDLSPDGAHALAEPLAARRYDGLAIAATPDGRIVYMTPRGPRHATAARLRYRGAGRVVGFRLDAGQAQARWGRVFIDACLPPDTALRVQGIVSDDDLDGPRLARTAPANQAPTPIARPEATPLPLQAVLPAPDEFGPPVFKRTDGSEQPWLVEGSSKAGREAAQEATKATERFDTFEALAPTTPGRYLWLVFDLQGHSRATPKLRGVRAETPAHDWLSRLPQLYARQAGMRDFLQRFMAPLAGLDDDLAAQSDGRHAMLKPCSTPAAALPWLARWVGLTLDERWSETARRSFIKEAPWLFRLRGTVWSLKRMVEIVSGAPVLIVEQFRLRGLGRLGPDPLGEGWDEPALVGMGLRVGGPRGNAEAQGDAGDIADSFALNAHRFSVLVQAALDADTEAAVRHLLDVHRPAHTLVTLCTLGQGARLGRSLQIGLSTVVGGDAGFTPLQLGGGTLGRTQVLGRPAVGAGLRLA